jgi:hypothetical protein
MELLHQVLRARTQVNITGIAAGTFRGWCERNAGTFR